jgi:serine/threonine-protein kinase
MSVETLRGSGGSYVLHSEIASGGMASVHLGRRVEDGTLVAIKRLHDEYAGDPELVTMLLDEARVTAHVRHPNVAALLDVVTDPAAAARGGLVYLVFEYVAGESLSRLVAAAYARGEPIPEPVVVAILYGVLEGLHAAHEARDAGGRALGVIHRDVSPENVLVGADGVPRVVDFGIAKAVDRAQPTTHHGRRKGKTAYMAPEQLVGRAIDRRVDVWAASVVLWELLARRRLFAEESPSVLARMIVSESVSPPSLVAPCSVAFDAVVLRGLSKEPDGRFASAHEMALAIEAVRAPASSGVVADWVRRLAGERLRRRRLLEEESGRGPPRDLEAKLGGEPTGVARGRSGPPLAPAPSARSEPPVPLEPLATTSERRWGVPMLLAVGLAVALALGLRASLKHRVAPAGATPSSASEGPGPPPDHAEPEGSAAPLPPSPPTGTLPTATPSGAHRRPLARPGCNPPYTVGPPPDFIRTPKPQCF